MTDQTSPVTATLKHLLVELRDAFDSDLVPRKNIALKKAWVEIEKFVAADHAQRQQEPGALEAAYEKHAKPIFGTRPRSLDSITHFYAGWQAALSDTSTLQSAPLEPAPQNIAERVPSSDAAPGGADTWPNRCHDPDSCARHFCCMYVQCPHMKRGGNELAQEIRAVVVTSPDRSSK